MADETTQAVPAPAADQTVNLEAPVEQKPVEQAPVEGQQAEPEQPEQVDIVVDEEKGEEGQEEKKKLSGSQRLKRRLTAVEAEFLELQRQNEELQSKLAPEPQKDGKPGVDREPTEADFPNDYFAYERSWSAWNTRQVIRDELGRREQATKQKDQDRALVEYRQERIEALHEQAETVRERIADFDKVVNSATGVPVSQELANELLASDKAALLQYYLAKNPDKVRELNSLNGRELAREMGRLEARVHLPASKKATQADPPLSQPRGGAAPPVNLATADMDTYVAVRRKQMGKA